LLEVSRTAGAATILVAGRCRENQYDKHGYPQLALKGVSLMCALRFSWVLFVILALPVLKAKDPDPQADRNRIERLIKQLGDDDFADRQSASKELDAIGEPALERLRAAVGDPDLEVRKRAQELVEKISVRRTMRLALVP